MNQNTLDLLHPYTILFNILIGKVSDNLKSSSVKKILLIFCSLFLLGSLSAQEVQLKNGKYYSHDGILYSGLYKEFNANKTLLSETNISAGLLDGISIYYYDSGSKKEQRSYTKGLKDGLWINWNESGKKTAEARFNEGKKDGYWYIWDEKGTKRYEMFYKSGEKSGTWYIWDETGKQVTEQKYD
jgi:antitoxin component YwqK of YwqJK toxin-antitoxin module